MLQSITRFSVRYPVTVSMIILATLLLGYISFGKLGIDLFPNLHSPRLFVEIRSGERPPEEMEDRFVDRIEALAIRQSGVVNVASVSRVGVAQIEVEYAWEKDMNEAFLDLSKALAVFNQDEELDEMNITQFDPNADPVMLVAFRHREHSNLDELRSVAGNYVRNELIRLEGIADVSVDGAGEMEVLIETSDYLLESYNIDLATITARINSYNQNISGGSIVEMGRRYIVRGLSELEQISDLKDVIIRMAPSGEEGERVPVLLRDVASVSYSPKEQENAVTLNGAACIGLSIYKEMRYNTVKAVDDLREALEEMEKALPGYTFTVVEDQGNFISGAIGEVRDSLIGGILLAVFVLMLFLRRIGPTAIVSIAIPISIIATFVLMYFTGLTLNIMTLGGLALGAGMLVDNAIVVLENIFRNHEAGKSTDDAAVSGTSQVGGAIIASTLTTIVVFIPIVYLHGASGELFREQAITVAFSLLCSLFVAILIIPMLYFRLYRKRHPFAGKARSSVKFTGYGRLLGRILDRNVWVLLGAALLMAGGWFMLKQTGSEFMPRTDAREFYVDPRMPEGTRLERTMGAVQSMEEIIRGVAGDAVEMIYSEIGPASGLASGGENVFDDQNMATIKVLLKDEGAANTAAVITTLSSYYDGALNYMVRFRQEETALQTILGTAGAPLVVELRGKDMEVLEQLTLPVMEKLHGIEGVYNIASSIEGGAPEVEILIDRYQAGLMNVDVNTLITRVSEKLQGVDAGEMNVKGELTDITVKLGELSLRELEMLTIEVNNATVLLRELADIRIGTAPREILHNNQNRIVEITADLAEDVPLDRMAVLIEVALSEMDFPPDYTYRISGEEAMRKDSVGNLLFALLLSLVLVYMVLAAQFESLLHPFTILLTVPLAVVGAVAVFFIMGKALNIMAIIGIIMLVGIAVNDSIILVDAINQFRREGMALKDSIIAAGQRRIRPIIMTTLTTILALLPLTFGFGESASLRSPMALAVIGGLVTSTLLTLVVIPSIYMLLARLEPKRAQMNTEESE
ncbi:MAG: efflux RND transporter permease subunit [Bacteroidales bacterium]|nr:efflux RND transporter permease subunit [Bacteroidales bacterium]MDT8432785.1 efflux RND transporter permease subunit [Bacteroidales bacterium]